MSEWGKGIITFVFLMTFFRLFFLHPTFSDENFYFNVARNLAKGLIPYKDFFFAHPPFQIYWLAFLFKIFGSHFLMGKFSTLIVTSFCVLIVYLIAKKMYDEKTGFFAAVLFSTTPAFISFSLIGYGMWEAMFFILISIYLVLKNRITEAILPLVLALFTRYVIMVYLPFFLLLVYLRKRKIIGFFVPFLLISFFMFLSFLIIFGNNFLEQTFKYHLTSKFGLEITQAMQYWQIGFFTLFLALIAIYASFIEKDGRLLFFALTPLVVDSIILFIFDLFFYHYFLISLPFYAIASGITLKTSKNLSIKFFVFIVIFLSLISNIKTIDFYINPIHAKKFYTVVEIIKNETAENEKIFGEPVITNYVSFVTGKEISVNYLDSYLSHLMFEGEEKVIENLEKDKPKIFIEMKLEENYFSSRPKFREFILTNYELEKKIEGIPSYFIYKLKKY